MKKLLNNIIAFIVIIILLGGCSEDYLEENPPHLITAETILKNLEGFETLLNGINTTVKYEYAWQDGMLMPINLQWCGTDIMVSNNPAQFGLVTEHWGVHNNSYHSHYRLNFAWYYSIVNAANTIINRSERDDIDWTGGGRSESENKNKVLAEARAYRAWAYRHLTFRWGDVPLTLNESLGSSIKTDWERTPVDEVRRFILNDLLFAEKYLDVSPETRGKITKGAVQHYLSEMYLAVNKPDSALLYANKVTSNPEYALITERYGVKADEPGVPFMDMFYDGNSNREEGNTEALWVLQHEYGVPGSFGSTIMYINGMRYYLINWDGVVPFQIALHRGGRGLGWFALTKWAIDNYESQDDRGSNYAIRKHFILTEDNGPGAKPDILPPGKQYGDTLWLDWSKDITSDSPSGINNWPFPRKMEGAPETFITSHNYYDHVKLRAADTYLLKAEAQFKLGDLSGAANTINIIRRRSNASDINEEDIDIDFILDERARELLWEEDRRYTLLRTGKWLERVNKYNKKGGQFATERDKLFPIPQNVIDANLTGKMEQNPGFD